MATQQKDKTSLGIVGTGAMLMVGGVAVGVLLCGGGFGAAVLERLPEIVYAPEPVKIPATSHRLPDVLKDDRQRDPVARRPGDTPVRSEPNEPDWTPEPRVFREPARWTEGAETPLLAPTVLPPRPVEPLIEAPPVGTPVAGPFPQPVPMPSSVVPQPVFPQPTVPVAPQQVGPTAMVSVSGDAVAVVARPTHGRAFRLPGLVPPGTYDVVVTFAGREPFSAGSLLVLDAGPRSVTCRSSLGICKIR